MSYSRSSASGPVCVAADCLRRILVEDVIVVATLLSDEEDREKGQVRKKKVLLY